MKHYYRELDPVEQEAKRSHTETSSRGELDYVVTCGDYSWRFADNEVAVLAAYRESQRTRLVATVHTDGECLVSVVAGEVSSDEDVPK